MPFIDTLKSLFGAAWHVNADAIHRAMWPAVDGTPEASKPVTTDANNKVAVLDVTQLKVGGVDKSNTITGVGAGYKFARGQATTVTASDTIATGLATVVAVVASFDADPGDDPQFVSASIGDQAGAPVAGSFLLKTWKNTGGTDPTPLAATTFAKKVNWIAIGT